MKDETDEDAAAKGGTKSNDHKPLATNLYGKARNDNGKLEYWSLRLGFNILPEDWQSMMGRCKYCASFQPPGKCLHMDSLPWSIDTVGNKVFNDNNLWICGNSGCVVLNGEYYDS
eukprot:g22563.t1